MAALLFWLYYVALNILSIKWNRICCINIVLFLKDLEMIAAMHRPFNSFAFLKGSVFIFEKHLKSPNKTTHKHNVLIDIGIILNCTFYLPNDKNPCRSPWTLRRGLALVGLNLGPHDRGEGGLKAEGVLKVCGQSQAFHIICFNMDGKSNAVKQT